MFATVHRRAAAADSLPFVEAPPAPAASRFRLPAHGFWSISGFFARESRTSSTARRTER